MIHTVHTDMSEFHMFRVTPHPCSSPLLSTLKAQPGEMACLMVGRCMDWEQTALY